MSGRLIHGEGTAEAVWLPWLHRAQVPELPLATWLPASRRMVVVAPHPDDEVLACGGLLHAHARNGGSAVVIAVTDGEASHADVCKTTGAPEVAAADLAATRRLESQSGLLHLAPHCQVVHRLGLPDGQVAANTQRLTDVLTRLLRPDDLVVSTWRLDGHPDHDATGAAAVRACAEVGCPLLEAPVWMWHWALPDQDSIPWHRLRAVQMPASALAAKQLALQQHASQLWPRSASLGPVLNSAILARAWRAHEYFFV